MASQKTQELMQQVNSTAQEVNAELMVKDCEIYSLRKYRDELHEKVKRLEFNLDREIFLKMRESRKSDYSLLWMIASWACFAAYFTGSMLSL